MNSQFQSLPQIEFPENVKNIFCFKIILCLMFHLSFMFLCSVIYSLTPAAFFFNPYLILAFGVFCMVLAKYAPQCKNILCGVYLFTLGYTCGYLLPYIYFEYAIVCILLSYLLVCIYLYCLPEKNANLSIMCGICVFVSTVCNTCLYYIVSSPNIVYIIVADVCIIVYFVNAFYMMNKSMKLYVFYRR